MGHEVFKRIEEASSELADRSAAADELGRLPDDVAKRLKDTGIVRMLQPAEFGGYEADPRDFLAAVMEVGHSCPSAGWVCGVVGVHPWELALNDERLQEEVWGDDPDTWMASPYAPMGTATPGRRRLHGGGPVELLLRDRPVRLGGARRHGARWRHRRRAVHAPRDAAPRRLRDRRRLVEGHGPRGHGQQGRGRARRLRPLLPDHRRGEGDGRPGGGRGRSHPAPLPHAVVDDLPVRGRRRACSGSPRASSSTRSSTRPAG